MGEGITNMLEYLMKNPYAWGILSVFTVFSLVFGIYSHLKNKRKKELSYYTDDYNIIGEETKNYNNLKILYNEREIDDLSETFFTIWNTGNEPIKNEDISNDRPLCIRINSKNIILDANVVTENEKSNRFSIKKQSQQEIVVNFDYVDSSEGVVVRVLHTGKLSDLNIDCKIIGGKQLVNFNKKDVVQKGIDQIFDFHSKTKFYFLLMGCTLLVLVMLLFSIHSLVKLFPISGAYDILNLVLSLLSFFITMFFAWYVIKTVIKFVKRERLFNDLFHRKR